MQSEPSPLHLFEGTGIEIEYMVVWNKSLKVAPIVDYILFKNSGEYADVYFSKTAWSNELVLHVIEIKTNGPTQDLNKTVKIFQHDIQKINGLLAEEQAVLLPGGMHPFMDPNTETKLWPHDNQEIYTTFDKIFNCKGHGWSNIQSVHINLPFANNDEFVLLHTAIRLILPLLPALGASSPIVENKIFGFMDARLEFYRKNQEKIPCISGSVIPEMIHSIDEYNSKILQPMYQEIAPFDPHRILQNEWLNARGAIARFERNAIEIRVLDVQEHPEADIAIVAFVIAILKQLINEKWSTFKIQQKFTEIELSTIFLACIHKGMNATITNTSYLQAFNYPKNSCTVREFLYYLFRELINDKLLDDRWSKTLELIFQAGNLSERILKALGTNFNHQSILNLYSTLAKCLNIGSAFNPGG